jgi:hypothetical protein
MKIRVRSLRVLMLLVIVSCISGCGGNSQSNETRKGTNTPPPPYTGVADAAAITANNAQTLTTGAVAGVDTTVATQTTVSFAVQAAISPLVVSLPIPDTTTNGSIAGGCGGNVSYTLTIDGQTGSFTGTFSFENYCQGGVTLISGSCTVDGVYALLTDEFETIDMTLTNLALGDYTQTGDILTDYRNYPSSSIIADLYNKKFSNGKTYWVNNYTIEMLDIGTGDESNVTAGQFYDPDYGYVGVSTRIPLITGSWFPFILDYGAEWPRSGQLLCSGESSSAILTAINATSYVVDADRDGDGDYEYNIGPFLWADL